MKQKTGNKKQETRNKKYITNNSEQTKNLGEKLAKEILKKKPKDQAFVIGLEGELGGGKTTFLQGFAKGLGIKEKILSPTFVIVKRFKLKNLSTYKLTNLYHFDCYRIGKSKELLDLGFKKIVSNAKNIIVIEWADKIKRIMPEDVLWIKFDFVDKKKRKIVF